MKKMMSILLAILCVFMPVLASAQESTVVKTTIPSIHSIAVSCGEHGSVTILSGDYTGNFTVTVPRLANFSMTAKPDSGYAVMQIAVNSLDGVEIEDGQIMFNSVHSDNSVKITFYELTETPEPTVTATAKPEATATAEPEATATAAPETTATAEPEATATAEPEATATAEPEATATAEPEATATAEPESTATAEPEATATAEPEATTTAEPTATAMSSATVTVEPTATPQPTQSVLGAPSLADSLIISQIPSTSNVLYDDYLGTGDGLEQLNIVFNDENQSEDYELLSLPSENSLLVRTGTDAQGNAETRSLQLSVEQLMKLAQKNVEQLIFENGEAFASVDMLDLLGGNMQKLLGLIAAGKEITPKLLNCDWDAVETHDLSKDALKDIYFELRIVPVQQVDGSTAYEITLWLHCGEEMLDVSSMASSLHVYLNVDALMNEENEANFAQLYAVGYQADQSGSFRALESVLLQIPSEVSDDTEKANERFLVSIPETNENPLTVYEPDAALNSDRHCVLAVEYAGEGCYKLVERK